MKCMSFKEWWLKDVWVWPLLLWLQITITFLIAYIVAIVLAVYVYSFPTNPSYILLSAIIIYDGTRGTIKTGVQRIFGTVVGLGIGLGVIFAVNALPSENPFLYSYKTIVLGVILAPLTGMFIGWSKGQPSDSLLAYNSYFFKYVGVTISLGSLPIIDTQNGEINIAFVVSRVIGIVIGAAIGSIMSFTLSAPSRRVFRNSLSIVSNRCANLLEVTGEVFYEEKHNFFDQFRPMAAGITDALTATQNLLSETSTPTLSGIVFKRGGRERYTLAMKRLQRCRYHIMFLFYERVEVAEGTQSSRTSLELDNGYHEDLEMRDIDHSYHGHDLTPVVRGFQRFLTPGMCVVVSEVISQIVNYYKTDKMDDLPLGPDVSLIRNVAKETCKTLRQIATHLKTFPLNLDKVNATDSKWRADEIFAKTESEMGTLFQRTVAERARTDWVSRKCTQGESWNVMLSHVQSKCDPNLLQEAFILGEYRNVILRLMRLQWEVLELLNLVYCEILVPH